MDQLSEKKEIREKIWRKMKKENIERFPYAWGRIPNFRGAEKAAAALATLPVFTTAKTVFVAPDSPQNPVRKLVLLQKKVLIMPTPRLKAGFLIIEPVAGMETKASSLKGAFTFGRTVTINDIPVVDLVVQGAVAVDTAGRRIGKGGGYGDREVAALKKHNKMPTAPITVTVHDIQVVEKLPQNAWDFTVDIIVTPTQIINTTKRKAISKYMSSILRHHPPDTMSDNGFIPLKELFVLIQEKYNIDKEFITSIAEKDSKGRFQIKGEKIRALYGHSCPVTIELPPADSAVLYHGTTAKAAEKIRSQGLIPKKRQKVHLSPTPDVAVEVGKRKCKNPVVLKIDAEKALKEGVIIEKASDSVYVADFIPPQYIS